MKNRKMMLLAVLVIGVLAFAACEEEVVPEETMYVDGMYATTAEGYGGEIELQVTIEDDVISEIEVISHNEPEEMEGAIDGIIDQAIGQQSTEGIEVVNDAEETSNAVIEAIDEAFELAATEDDAT